MSIKANISIVYFRVSVVLLMFCLENLSIAVSGVLKTPTMIYSHQFLPLRQLIFIVGIWVLLY